MGWARTPTSKSDATGPPLPSGFVSIRDVLEENEVRPGSLVNICGMVKDFQAPMSTAKSDWKATMTLYDLSTQDDTYDIDFSIFRPKDNIPEVGRAAIVLLYQVKVQRWNSNPISLITNYQTKVRVYSPAKIPEYPQSAAHALQPRAGKEVVKEPTETENKYVSYFYHEIDKQDVPDEEAFQVRVTQSLNVKEKFSLLEDVAESRFCDLIVQVCRDPYDLGDKMTLYVSDYTANDAFFNYTREGVEDLDSGNGDIYGYTSRNKDSDTTNKWVGPYGKRAMQVTCWDPHATVIREEVHAGDWISLRNVQPKFGRDSAILEGALREDRNLPGGNSKVRVAVLDTSDKDYIDPRLKEAIRRCRDYTKEKGKQVQSLKASEGKRKREPAEPDTEGKRKRAPAEPDTEGKRKRKAAEAVEPDEPEESSKQNAKARRKRQRAEVQKKVEAQEAKFKEEVLGLNPLIVCESGHQSITELASILEQKHHAITIEGSKIRLPLPFTCANYCANIRVVDFKPGKLEDFACPSKEKKQSAFDVLSDNSGSEQSSGSEDEDDDHINSRTRWEWRFALQLEDASPKVKNPERVWVVVNNLEAQCLTGLDASNLRKDEATLTAFREKLFTMWGELEEKKHWQQSQAAQARKRKPGAAPPPSASDDEDGGRRNGSATAPTVSNKPFTCCIRQYGIKEREDDPAKADAGERHRWQRLFGLFGTKINS